jgi:hypothetical protein
MQERLRDHQLETASNASSCTEPGEFKEREQEERMETASYASSHTEPGEIAEGEQEEHVNLEEDTRSAPLFSSYTAPYVTDEDVNTLMEEILNPEVIPESTILLEYEREVRIRREQFEYAASQRQARQQRFAEEENAEFERGSAAVARIQQRRAERKAMVKRADEEADSRMLAEIRQIMQLNDERKISIQRAEAEAVARDRAEINRMRRKSALKRRQRARALEREERIEQFGFDTL